MSFQEIWENLERFHKKAAELYDKEGQLILEIGPSTIHKTAKDYFKKASVKSLDIDHRISADFYGDLCRTNTHIKAESFDHIFCCEVLEHTVQPFKAVEELHRLLRPGGMAFISTPFMVEIHPPFPDCWRFTKMGLQELFKGKFFIDELDFIGPEGAPIQYTLVCRKRS